MFAETPLSASLASLSRFFVSDSTMQETLDRVADLCRQAIPAAAIVGLTMMIEGRPRTAVFTDPTSPEIDQAQYDTGEGPCLDAYRNNVVNRIPDVLADGPWPAFRAAAADHGIRSTLSMPLTVHRGMLGALNLYSLIPAGFTSDDEETASQFAAHAAVVLANANAYWDARQLGERLDQAMQARAIIEQAKGILMVSDRCSADDAFNTPVVASQRET